MFVLACNGSLCDTLGLPPCLPGVINANIDRIPTTKIHMSATTNNSDGFGDGARTKVTVVEVPVVKDVVTTVTTKETTVTTKGARENAEQVLKDMTNGSVVMDSDKMEMIAQKAVMNAMDGKHASVG